jgi:hypothetical protein
MPTPPLQGSFTSDGVASTYRMHPVSRDLGDFRQKKKSMPEFSLIAAPLDARRRKSLPADKFKRL